MAARRGGSDPVEDVEALVDEDDVDELSSELEDAELEEDLEDDDGGDDDELPEGFSVVDPDEAGSDAGSDEDEGSASTGTASDAGSDADRAVAVLEAVGRESAAPADDDDDDELAIRRAGEFVCSRCHLVKRDTQLARPRLRICRDCA